MVKSRHMCGHNKTSNVNDVNVNVYLKIHLITCKKIIKAENQRP